MECAGGSCCIVFCRRIDQRRKRERDRASDLGGHTVNLFFICSRSASRTSMCIPKNGQYEKLVNATGKWVLEKGQFTHVSARKDVSANRNGEVGGKWEWKNGDGKR